MPPKQTAPPGGDPPEPQQCSRPDCEYTTPAGAPTWELTLGFLTQHIAAAHPAPAATVNPLGAAPHSSKLEKLHRPSFSLAMSEGQWEFLSVQWKAYIGQTNVNDSQHLQ